MHPHIDFVASRRWIIPWCGVAMALAIAVGYSVAKHRRIEQQLAYVEAAAAENITKGNSLRAERARVAAAATQDAGARQLELVRTREHFDWNPLFATIETLQEPGARLISVSATLGDEIRVEYRVPTIDSANRLTAQLNGNSVAAPWQLQTVTTAQSGNSVGPAEFSAIWTARLSQAR